MLQLPSLAGTPCAESRKLFAACHAFCQAGDNFGVGTAGSVLATGGRSDQGGVSKVRPRSVEAVVTLARLNRGIQVRNAHA